MLTSSLPAVHDQFVSILHQIEAVARFSCRFWPHGEREEFVAETVAYSWLSFVRLIRRGKDPTQFPTILAKYAVKSVKAGKLIGQRCNRRDLCSRFRKKPSGFRIVSLHAHDLATGEPWKEVLVESRRATPAATAACRLDFAAWLRSLSRRDRRVAEALAAGSRSLDVAREFELSEGRISQLRRELRQSWKAFQGELDGQDQETELAVA